MTRTEKQALTRRQVLAAAAEVFPKRGYHNTSVEEVADQAGLSIGAVYSNFESKADLFLALYEGQVARWIEDIEGHVSSGKSPLERTRGAGEWWAAFMRREHPWLLLELEFWAQAVREPRLRERFAVLYARLRETTVRLIDDAAAQFGVPLPAPAEQLGTAVTALCCGLIVEKLLDPDRIPDEAFGSLLDLVLGVDSRDQAPTAQGERAGE